MTREFDAPLHHSEDFVARSVAHGWCCSLWGSGGRRLWSALDIKDKWPFVRVAYIHNAGYLGGLTGLVLALVLVQPENKGLSSPASATDVAQLSGKGDD